MRFKCRFLKKKFLLLLITLGIGSALYANDELKSLADSLRRMIDEKPLFIQQKEQRINRIKCLLKGSGLTLEQKYKINFQLCNEYKKFVVEKEAGKSSTRKIREENRTGSPMRSEINSNASFLLVCRMGSIFSARIVSLYRR